MFNATQMVFLLRSVTLAVPLKKITIICQVRKCQQSRNTPCFLGLFLFLEIKYTYIYQKKIDLNTQYWVYRFTRVLATGLESFINKLYVPVTVHREQSVKKEYQQDAKI